MDMSNANNNINKFKQINAIKKKLKNIIIEGEADGLVVAISGDQDIEKVFFESSEILGNKERLEKAIYEATNKALKKSKEVTAEKMRGFIKQNNINT